MRFRGWELRLTERVLIVSGAPVAIGGRAFDVLLALAERVNEVVTKGQLLERAWPGRVVEENNVSVQIATLRKALGTSTISTMSGRGYRLNATPELALNEPTPGPAERPWPATGLFGRDADLQALLQRVGTMPLVSIVGSGGVGKTSLARAVVSRLTVFPVDELHWIDLAPLREGAQVVPLVAKSLGIDLDILSVTRSDLVLALAREQLLIVLDNCEHLLADVAELVAQALQGAPGVRWLTTSQAPLRLTRESVYRLEPLALPAPGAAIDEALRSGAIALLRHRSIAADRHFVLDASNLPLAVELCRRLDGLPLAIEIAAARVATLGLQAVHDQLGHWRLLLAGRREGPARQQALGSALDWSYELLSPAEQTVFRRLQPFVGGFALVMARRLVCDNEGGAGAVDEMQALEAISALVDKSLVQRDRQAPGRFYLLESARDYAAERLAGADETSALQRRHAEVVAAWFDRAREDYDRLRDEQWRTLYVPERHNVRAALSWACSAGDPDLLARLVAALAQIDSFVRGQAEVVQCNVPLDVLDQAAPPLRAAACLELSWAHYLDGSRRTSVELTLRALQDYEAIGDRVGTYRALAQFSRLCERRPGMFDEAKRAWERFLRIDDRAVPPRTRLFCAISGGPQYGSGRTVARLQQLQELAQRSGFDTLVTVCMVQITDELLVEGRFEEAVETARRFVGSGDLSPRIKGTILMNQVLALVQLGRTAELGGPVRAALRALPNDAYLVLTHLALAAAREGRLVDAALMTGYCQRVRRERDEHPDAAEAAAVEETAALMRRGLAAEYLDELLRTGAGMPVADILAMAVPL